MSHSRTRTAPSASDVRLLSAEVELLAMNDVGEQDLLQRTVQLAAHLTGSRIAHAHYVDADQVDLRPAATLSAGPGSPDAGIWTEAVRLQTPQSRSTAQPGDHVVVHYLSVPVVDDGRVVLLLGVGGATAAYGPTETGVLQKLADVAWLAVSRLRERDALLSRLDLVTDRRSRMGLAAWEWDLVGDEVIWDGVADQLIPGFAADDRSWVPLLAALDESSSASLVAALGAREPFSVELTGQAPDGSGLKVLVQADWSTRSLDSRPVLRGTLADVSLVSALEQAHRQATHDALTGLPNRAWLIDALSQRVLRPRLRRSDSFALYFIDLNNFRAVNDDHGRIVGDEVLVACAQRIERQTRDRENVARYGGDEFVLIQDGPLTWESVESLAHRIRAAVAEPLRIGQKYAQVGASVGVAICSDSTVTVADLLRNADQALFEAKRSPWGVVIRDL